MPDADPLCQRPRFFTGERTHLFRPLAGRHREAVLACLRAFYHRLHGPEADLDTRFDRPRLRQLFHAAIQDAPPDDETAEPIAAGSMVRLLDEEGWIEEYRDSGSMRSAFRFTRVGKQLTERLVELDQRQLRTRQRNVRNVRNALAAFIARRDPYDLIDATDYSRRVVQDIQADIEQLEERKLDLFHAAAAEASRETLDGFLDYLENTFAPDVSLRMSADNVERHSNDIRQMITAVGAWPEAELYALDDRLTPLAGRLQRSGEPVAITLLYLIHRHITHAAEEALPRLRDALEGYFRRAGLIIKQATAMVASRDEDRLEELFEAVREDEDTDAMLRRIAHHLDAVQVRLPDPARVRPRKTGERKRAEVASVAYEPSEEDWLEAARRNAEERAFVISIADIRARVLAYVGERTEIRLSELPCEAVHEVLTALHAVELAATSLEPMGAPYFEVEPLPMTYRTPYFESDDFIIRLRSDEPDPNG